MQLEKRKYQEKAVQNFLKWAQDPTSQRIGTFILPCGCGKTATASLSFKELFSLKKDIKLLWVAHREELIDQAQKTLNSIIENINIEIEMADQKATIDAVIVTGSVQTIARNRKNLYGWTPDFIVIDEWHHYDLKNTQYNGLLERFPKAKILGLTGTPYRFSGGDLPLGEKLIEMDIGTAIRNDFLVKPKPEVLYTDVSLVNVGKRAGDFDIKQLSETVNVERRNKLIAERIIKAVKDENRQGILFCVDVNHSKAMYQLLKNYVRVAEVYGETDKETRREIMQKMRNGEIDILTNFAVLTEGFDAPHINFVCMARPTLSLGFYTQGISRGLRKSPGKTDCLIIDVFDLVKIQQKRIGYSDVAKAGDIDGNNKRLGAVLKEPLAEELKNFPIMIELGENERFAVDDETWFAPAWQINENQWIISWNKTEERVLSTDSNLVFYDKPPNKWGLIKKHQDVKHRFFGNGKAFDLLESAVTPQVMVNFENGIGVKLIDYNELQRVEQRFEKHKLDKPIKRIFLLTGKSDYMRLISLMQDGGIFKVIDDMKGDKESLNEMVKSAAEADDMIAILKTDSKWRLKPPSDKQLNFAKQLSKSGELDFSTMTAGDASSIIDQKMWKPTINKLFGTSKQENLIGYKDLYSLEEV